MANSNPEAVALEEPQPEQYMDVVRRLARSLGRRLPAQAIDLEELEADGFEALVRAVRDYDDSKGPLIPYIILRCRGAMVDGLRRKMSTRHSAREKGVKMLSLEHHMCEGVRLEERVADPHAATADDVIERVSSADLRPELAALPHRCRRIAFARFIQNRSREDVAAAEGISRGTVAQLELRIRRRLVDFGRSEDEAPLTPEELKVLRLAAEGASSDEIARRLRKAYETVKAQRRTIIAKLRARNIVNAVAIGYERGLLH
jgi:RNA polymerase sigma factor (sigma-70 family)